MEIWKDIKGYEGHYRVSNLSRVSSTRRGSEKILKAGINGHGYYTVVLCLEKNRESRTIHRLVAEAFIPNPENKPQVNHIDSDRKNSVIENLEWVTAKENNRHAVKFGFWKPFKGSASGMAKLTEKDIPVIRSLISKGWSNTKIGKLYGVSNVLISCIKLNKNWTHVK